MTTAANFCEAGSSVYDHDAKPAGILIQLLFIENNGRRQAPLFPSARGRHIGHQILFRQGMAATDDLLKSLAAAHDFDDQPTGMRVPLEFVEDIAFLQCHNSSIPGDESLSPYNVGTFVNRAPTCSIVCNNA